MSIKNIMAAGEEPMKKTIEKMKYDFAAIRTGRASVALVEGLKVDSYGSILPINQIASLSVSDARTIEIRPWDISQLQSIEKAIQKSELGLTPINDGKVIRLAVPSLTEQRRKEIIKVIHKMAEEYKIAIRNERRDINETIKKSEKDKLISEDDRKKAEVELQKLTDNYIKKIDELLLLKENEVKVI